MLAAVLAWHGCGKVNPKINGFFSIKMTSPGKNNEGCRFFFDKKVKSNQEFLLKIRHFLIPLIPLTLALSACASGNLVTPNTSGSTPSVVTPSISTVLSPTITTEITPTSGNCAYVEASQELPDLSKKVYDSMQALDTNITGNAYAYGENCVYEDGHFTFSPKETDFRVKVIETNLKDEKALGDSMAKVMESIVHFPPDEIVGPLPGRVEFDFSKTETENLFLNVSIAEYQKLQPGISGIELFRHFNKNP
jgi:hypothetical protein